MAGQERIVLEFRTAAVRLAAGIRHRPLLVYFDLYALWASSFALGAHLCVGQHCH